MKELAQNIGLPGFNEARNFCPRFFAGAHILTALIPGSGSNNLITSPASFESGAPRTAAGRMSDAPQSPAAATALFFKNLRLELFIKFLLNKFFSANQNSV
ncbi:MAG: hypothetical protein ABI891_04525 [Acidobacteriota bacterium]